jgi:hypothetical protein
MIFSAVAVRWPADDIDVVAAQLGILNLFLALDDAADPLEQFAGRYRVAIGAVHVGGPPPHVGSPPAALAESQNRLANGFGGYGSGMQANPANNLFLLHDRHAFAQLGALHGGPLAGRSAADTNHVVIVLAHDPTIPQTL